MVVTITVKTASEALELKSQLTRSGLQDLQDYTWRFIPAEHTWLGDIIEPARAEFDFFNEMWATYYSLKWSR